MTSFTPSDWSVVSVNFAKYDEVGSVPAGAEGIDWVYVTDDPSVARRAARGGWRSVVDRPKDRSALVSSRVPKARPDLYTGRRRSVYLDGRFVVRSSEAIEVLARWAEPETWLALFRHDDRSDIFEEAAECQRLGIGGSMIERQMEHYRQANIGARSGLWCGGVIVSRHCRMRQEFGDAWLREIHRWPTRDQLSLPVVLEEFDIKPTELPGSIYRIPGIDAIPHRVRRAATREVDRRSFLGRVKRRFARLPIYVPRLSAAQERRERS